MPRNTVHSYSSSTICIGLTSGDIQAEEGERLAQPAPTIGQRLRGHDALGIFGVQMFTLRREQGRLQELAPAVRSFVQVSPETSTWRPGLALIYSELGLE